MHHRVSYFKKPGLQVEEGTADFDPDFLRHTYPKLDWAALKGAAESLGNLQTLIGSVSFNV